MDIEGLPQIVFTPWKHWLKRTEIPNVSLPGVYLLARFSKPPEQKEADPLFKEIVIIGQSRQSLRTRWNAFDKAAFHGGGNHSTGNRYREKNYPNAIEELYVAAMTSSPLQWRDWAKLSDEKFAELTNISVDKAKRVKKYFETSAPAKLKGVYNNVWIMYVERYLLLQYVFKWGKLPECNAE